MALLPTGCGSRTRLIDQVWFRERLARRGLANRTIKLYVSSVVRADAWMRLHHACLDDCSGLLISHYMDEQIPNTYSSRKLCRSAFSMYWEEQGRDDAPVNAIRVPPKKRFSCRAIEDHEARKLADVAYYWDQGGEGVAVLLGLYAALRRFEIAKVRWEDVDGWGEEEGGWLRVVGKGDVDAEVPLHPKIMERLAWWRGFTITDPTDCRVRPGVGYVFQGRYGKGVSPATVWDWCKRLAREAGIEELTTHQLRHTCLARANDITRDLRGVQQLARHADPSTTVLYTRVDRERLRGIVGAIEW